MESPTDPFYIPFFAHKQHGGKKARVLSISTKKARLQLVDSNKTLYVDPAHIQHLLYSQLQPIQTEPWIEDFKVTKDLGQGTYGSVASVVRTSDKKTFALKTIMHLESEGLVAPSIEECVIFQTLQHPNLVKPLEVKTRYDVTEKKLYLYFLMEEMTMNLRGLFKKYSNRPLPRQLCEYVIVGILQGIHHMNQQGYSHSDLSPNNVLIKTKKLPNGQETIERVCLTDFSLSRALNGRKLPTKIVTCWYRAPELFAGYQSFTLAINMWSIGMIGLECLCGHPIFWRTDATHTVERIMDICGIPSQQWVETYGHLPKTTRHIFGNESTTKLDRIQHVMTPRPIKNCQDVKVHLTKDYSTLVKFLLGALEFEPTKRISTRAALRTLFGQTIEQGQSPLLREQKMNQTIVNDVHFKKLCEWMMTPFRHRTCPLHVTIVDLSVRLFDVSQSNLRFSQWSLLMVACCSLACKYVVYDKMSMLVSPDVQGVLGKIGVTGKEYNLDDVRVAECFVINQGGLLEMKS